MLTDLCELCYACYWESLGQLWVSSSHRARLYVNGSTGGTMGIGGDIGQPKLLILSGNFTKQWDLWSQFPSYFQILFWILTQISIRFKIVGVSKVVLLKISKKWWRLWLSIINFISPDLKTWNKYKNLQTQHFFFSNLYWIQTCIEFLLPLKKKQMKTVVIR